MVRIPVTFGDSDDVEVVVATSNTYIVHPVSIACVCSV